MAEIGYATLGIIPSFDGFSRKLDSGTRGAMTTAGRSGGTVFGDAAGKSAGSRFGSVFKSAAKAGLVGIGALGVGAFALAKDSISLASDLEESTNKVNQVFGKGADQVFRFSERAADALGQTNQAARDAAATFGLFGNIAGLSDRKSARFATRMTTLASDLASFHNTEPEQAVEALGAALRGEAEPIRSFGVLLDEATLKAQALKMGLLEPVKDQAKIKSYQVAILDGQKKYNDAVAEFGPKSLEALKAEAALGTARDRLKKATEGTIPALTQQQKVLAAQSAIFDQTKVAQGDFARTSDGLANQQRRLKARFEDSKAALGAGLLPIMTDAADFLLDKGIPAFEKFSKWFSKEGVPKLKEFGGFLRDDVAPPLKTAAGFAEDLAGFLNDLPKEVKIGGLAALAGGAAALKLRGGKGGLLGSAGSALGVVKPIRTFETNPAALGRAGLGAGAGAGAGAAGAAGTRAAGLGRMLGRGFVAFLVADGIYEALVGDAFGLDNDTNDRSDIDPILKTGGGAFGAGLNNDPDALGGKTFRPALTGFEKMIDGAASAGDAVDRMGLRIGAAINGASKKAGTFDDKLTLVGSRKIRPEIELRGVDRAHGQIDSLSNALTDLANQAATGIDAAGRTVVDAVAGNDLPRRRRRGLGGMP